jgi:putative ABC transport system permease protein
MSIIKKFDLVTPVVVILLLVAFSVAMSMKPGLLFYWIIIFISIGAITISVLKNIVLFKVGTRNISRRKGYSVIVILGLMIGTIIIASSLIVGDTMEKMIVSLNYKVFDEVDEVVNGREADGSMTYLSEESYINLSRVILEIPNVEGVTGEVEETVSIKNEKTSQNEPNYRLVGYNVSSKAFGAFYNDGKEMPFDLAEDEVYMDTDSAKALEAEAGHGLSIITPTGKHFLNISAIVDTEGRTGWAMGRGIYMPLERAQYYLNVSGINIIKVTNEGDVVGGEEHCEGVVKELEKLFVEGGGYDNLEVTRNKAKEVSEGREGMSQFSDMFLVFGSFSIIAGVILIINIFVMLAEERKGEMGISRAVGMKRLHLGRSFLYEGSIYAFISAVIGAAMGILVAYLVILFTESIFSSFGEHVTFSILDNFNFTSLSIIQAFTFGMLITLITVSFASKRVSKLNIVRAIRNIPEPKIPKKSTRMLIFGIATLVVGVGLGVLAIFVLNSYQLASIYVGISFVVLGIGFIIRRYLGDRWSITIASGILLIFWSIPGSIFPFPDIVDDIGGMEFFVLSGIFLVSSGVVLFVYNSSQILGVIVKLWGLTNRPTASLKTATSYPMKNKFRTGMTIYMFALIIFTITVMYMIIGIMSYNIEKTTQEQMGGLDIVGIANPNNPIDNIEMRIEENPSLSLNDFNAVYSITSGYTLLNTSKRDPGTDEYIIVPSSMYGFGNDFSAKNRWTFNIHSSVYETEREVWQAVFADSNLVILDGSFVAADEYGPPNPATQVDAKIGKNITMIGTDGRPINKTVVGILDQFIFSGIFMSENAMEEEFNLTIKGIFLFDLVDGDKGEELAKVIEREFSINAVALKTAVEQFTNIMEQFFNLFTAFMSLGLIVGIAGLGIITLRAVHERRQEIGVMRSIGFKRRHITMSFIQESAFISLAGIIIGVTLGVIIGYAIWYDGFKVLDYDFYIPWSKILVVALIAFVSTAVFTIPPSYSASKVEPADALRYE